MPILNPALDATLEILGCSGSLGEPGNGTSCLLLGSDTLIDAGSGLMSLTTSDLGVINQVFLSHSHLDHVCSLPFLIETRQHFQETPLKVYGLGETIDAVRLHLFNNVIWPDFTVIPSASNPAVEFISIKPASSFKLHNLTIMPICMNHSVPTLGYVIRSERSVFVIASDTYIAENFVESLRSFEQIDHLIIESSFSNKDVELSEVSMHLCPSLLAQQLRKISGLRKIWVSYLKEWDRVAIEGEIGALASEFDLSMLRQGQVFAF